MTISEKSAYLKGLMEGLKLNTESDEGKMIAAIVDLLGDMTKRVTDIEETTIAISDELDEIEEDLDAIEDFIMAEDEDDYEDYDDDDFDWDDEDDEEDDGEEGFDFGDEETTVYEVQCACGNITYTSSTKLTKGWKKSCGCLSRNYHPPKPKEKFAPFVDCVSYRPNISYGCVALKERLCESKGKCSFYKPKGG